MHTNIYTPATYVPVFVFSAVLDDDECGGGPAQVASSEERGIEEKGQEAVSGFFAIPIFALLGTAIPWAGWMALGWSGVLLAITVLLRRRPPVILILRVFFQAYAARKTL